VLATDLNVSLALSRIIAGGRLQLPPPLAAPLADILPLVTDRAAATPFVCSFEPHRLLPDHRGASSSVLGAARVNAVRDGAYHIYPCPHQNNLDALEVRYTHYAAAESQIRSPQEIFLDYGRDEALMYAQFALCLGHKVRLEPHVLASVDPQAFWAAVLRIEPFIDALIQHGAAKEVVSNWRALLPGCKRAATIWADQGPSHRHVFVKEDGWDVSTKDKHAEVGKAGALFALTVVTRAAHAHEDKKAQMNMEMQDFYQVCERRSGKPPVRFGGGQWC
jgi:hypothetical protein